MTYDRNTERYRRAIQLARLIILHYSPDLRGGQEHVVAILFDMNKLFERFIFVQLRRAETLFATHDLRISGQVRQEFWSSKSIRPDVVATFKKDMGKRSVILDTKWKVPKNDQPSDEDLKQMYVYNLQLGGCSSVLAYPGAGRHQIVTEHPYARSESFPAHEHTCGTYFIDLFDENNQLRKDIGAELIQKAIIR